MAHSKFEVAVLTPEGEIFAEEVEMVSTRTTVGSIGVLAGHAPLLAMLDPAELRLYRSDSDVVRFAQAEGYLQISGGKALLLVEEAHEARLAEHGRPARTPAAGRARARRRPGRTPSAGAWPSATSVAGRPF